MRKDVRVFFMDFMPFTCLHVFLRGLSGRRPRSLERLTCSSASRRRSANIDLASTPTRAPITAANFLKYVDGGFYTAAAFIARRGRTTTRRAAEPSDDADHPGRHQSGARAPRAFPPIPLERTSVTGLKHSSGVVSMARGPRRHRDVGLLHPARRPAVARLRRQAVRRRAGRGGVWTVVAGSTSCERSSSSRSRDRT